MKNYRSIYEKCLRCKIPDGFVIHHIDFNRENNEISNLIAIPEQLHKDYHKIITQIREQFGIDDNHIKFTTKINDVTMYEAQMLYEYCNIIFEIQKWRSEKLRIMHKIFNEDLYGNSIKSSQE